MTALIVIIVVAALVLGHHAGHAHANVRHFKARGLSPSVYWRAGMRGPWVSVRLPGGFRVGHKL